ncbi:MAG: protein kinase [Deltaproteobacteria bacterium]|nr:protein kinase [Deltaproteobacteria bacterium]
MTSTSSPRPYETPVEHRTAPARPGNMRLSRPAPAFEAGARIGEYRIVRLLGAGGMGSVYLARDEALDRDVAIKVIRSDAPVSLEILERFRAEARTMARVSHPHVVRIHALGEVDGAPYIVMEHVPGTNLAQLFADKGRLFGVAQTLAILDQICRGTSAMHATGLVHGDLKPSNVLFGPGFRIVVSDLGLSRRIGAPTTTWSTPCYGAPELFDSAGSQPELAPRIDVYSIGVMAYEFLTGQLPFASESERILAAYEARPPKRPSEVRPELGAGFDAPILAALSSYPSLRTATVDTFRRALEQVGVAASPTSPPLRILVADDDPAYCDIVRRTLARSFRGALIESAPDGASALASALHIRPDLIVTDIDMPLMNGVELVAELRSRPELADVPVIVLSAVGGPADWSLLERLGANAFVGKPFDAQQLCSVAHAITG